MARTVPAAAGGGPGGAARAGAKLIAVENLYMYGPTDGRPLTEDLPHAANTRKGAVRARMPRELMEAHASGRARVAIGRASDFFGPRVLVSAAGEQVFGRAVEGKGAQVAGDPDQPHTYTYVPDIGRGLVVPGEREEALGHAWHLPSPGTPTTREFVGVIFEEVGRPVRVQVAPKILPRALGLFNPSLRETIEMLYEFKEPFVVDHSIFERAFGDHATPLGEAIRDTVRWYRGKLAAGGFVRLPKGGSLSELRLEPGSRKVAKKHSCLVHLRDACHSRGEYAATVLRPTVRGVRGQDHSR